MLQLELGKGAAIDQDEGLRAMTAMASRLDQSSEVIDLCGSATGLNAAMLLAAALCDARGRCVREIQLRRCQLGADGATRVVEAIVHASGALPPSARPRKAAAHKAAAESESELASATASTQGGGPGGDGGDGGLASPMATAPRSAPRTPFARLRTSKATENEHVP